MTPAASQCWLDSRVLPAFLYSKDELLRTGSSPLAFGRVGAGGNSNVSKLVSVTSSSGADYQSAVFTFAQRDVFSAHDRVTLRRSMRDGEISIARHRAQDARDFRKNRYGTCILLDFHLLCTCASCFGAGGSMTALDLRPLS